MSYDYGTTFIHISEKFDLPNGKEKSKQVISQFYHSPADNRRVSIYLCCFSNPRAWALKHYRVRSVKVILPWQYAAVVFFLRCVYVEKLILGVGVVLVRPSVTA